MKIEVAGCKNCKTTIYSRGQGDETSCKCGAVRVTAGKPATKVVYEENKLPRIEVTGLYFFKVAGDITQFELGKTTELDVTLEQLQEDIASGKHEYGIVKDDPDVA